MSVFAWREWSVNPYPDHKLTRLSYALYGLYGALWYPDEEMQATCTRSNPGVETFQYTLTAAAHVSVSPPHSTRDIPSADCTCGVYATRRAPDLIFASLSGIRRIVGAVELWGKIIEAEFGYRAQYAQMRALIDDGTVGMRSVRSGLATIAEDYKVPLLSAEYVRREFFS
jgi:hypothetical protein